MLPQTLKQKRMLGAAKEVDSFENRMQKEAKDTSDKSVQHEGYQRRFTLSRCQQLFAGGRETVGAYATIRSW